MYRSTVNTFTRPSSSLLVLICLSCLSLAAAADRTSVVWQDQIGSTADDMGHELAIDTSGNIYFGATTQGEFPGQTKLGSATSFNLVLGKYDASGNNLWVNQFDLGILVGLDVSATGVYVAGSGKIYSRNSNGDALWEQTVNDIEAGLRLYGVATAGDGSGVYCCGIFGSLNNEKVAILKFDTDGNLLWQRDVGSKVSDSLNRRIRIASHNDGSVAVAAYENDNSVSPRRRQMMVAHYNTQGSRNWIKRIDANRVFDVAMDNAGKVIVAGDIGLACWAADGTFQWSQPGSTYGGLYDRADVSVANDGSIFMSTEVYVNNAPTPVLMRLQNNGSPLWADTPPFPALSSFFFPNLFSGDLQVDANGDMVMIESVASTSNQSEVAIMKLTVQPPGGRQITLRVSPSEPSQVSCEETNVSITYDSSNGAAFEGLQTADTHTFAFTNPPTILSAN